MANKEKAEISRREVVKGGGMAVAALLGAAVTMKAAVPRKSKKRRLVMVINLNRCVGCQACAVACKSENNVRLGGYRSWVNYAEQGTYPNVKRFTLPRLCNHCEQSTCSRVCPTKATYEREDGTVMIDKEKCIGCRYCVSACPYGARYFNWHRDGATDVARTPGTVDKCDFCYHRVDEGLEPSCVQTCAAQARTFGDLNDPTSEVSRIIHTNPTQVLMPDKGTEPHVFYIGLDTSVVKGRPEGGQ
jgi:tetrathionate reductase subunit B